VPYRFCVQFLPLLTSARPSAMYVRTYRWAPVFRVSYVSPTAIPTCEGNTRWPCSPARCMFFSPMPQRISL
jgi:hypothetical protein